MPGACRQQHAAPVFTALADAENLDPISGMRSFHHGAAPSNIRPRFSMPSLAKQPQPEPNQTGATQLKRRALQDVTGLYGGQLARPAAHLELQVSQLAWRGQLAAK